MTCLALLPLTADAAGDLDETRTLFINGSYTDCVKACSQAITDDESSDEWRVLLARSLLALGRYTNAYSVVTTNLDRFPWSVKLRLLGHEVCRRTLQFKRRQPAPVHGRRSRNTHAGTITRHVIERRSVRAPGAHQKSVGVVSRKSCWP